MHMHEAGNKYQTNVGHPLPQVLFLHQKKPTHLLSLQFFDHSQYASVIKTYLM